LNIVRPLLKPLQKTKKKTKKKTRTKIKRKIFPLEQFILSVFDRFITTQMDPPVVTWIRLLPRETIICNQRCWIIFYPLRVVLYSKHGTVYLMRNKYFYWAGHHHHFKVKMYIILLRRRIKWSKKIFIIDFIKIVSIKKCLLLQESTGQKW
jgi:hypothetical protein